MSTTFPTSIDTLLNPGVNDTQHTGPTGSSHRLLHGDVNDAIEAIEARVGVTGSSDVTTHENKISTLTTRTNGVTAAAAALTTRVSNLETTTNSVTSRVSNLETTTNTATGNIAVLTTKLGYYFVPNPVRNASFEVAQRGTSFSIANGTIPFTLDGWKGFRNTASAGMTVSRQVSLADTQGSGYAARIQRDNGNSVTDGLFFHQSIPTIDSYRFAGRTVTFSFRAKKGANFSSASNVLTALLITGTGTDQSVGAGLTGQATALFLTPTLTGSYVTYYGTVTLVSSVTQLAVQFSYSPVGTAGANDWFEVKDVRIDEGSYVVPHIPMPFAFDLAENQRFFWRACGVATDNFGAGQVNTTNTCIVWVRHPVPMRANAVLTVTNAAQFTVNDVSVANAASSVALDGGTSSTVVGASVLITTTNSTLTVGRIARVYVGATGYADFSAEI